MASERFLGWDGAYRGGTAPWDIGRAQPAVVRLAEAGGFTGRVLDAGCGSGENALFLASLGLDVVGVDASPTAIERARTKAASRGLLAEFVVADVCQLPDAAALFDSVLDCGFFHTLDDEDRSAYVAGLAAVVAPAARVQLLCFSDDEPWGGGPRRVSQAEIRSAFARDWQVLEIVPEHFETRLLGNARAWRATIERVVTARPG